MLIVFNIIIIVIIIYIALIPNLSMAHSILSTSCCSCLLGLISPHLNDNMLIVFNIIIIIIIDLSMVNMTTITIVMLIIMIAFM